MGITREGPVAVRAHYSSVCPSVGNPFRAAGYGEQPGRQLRILKRVSR